MTSYSEANIYNVSIHTCTLANAEMYAAKNTQPKDVLYEVTLGQQEEKLLVLVIARQLRQSEQLCRVM